MIETKDEKIEGLQKDIDSFNSEFHNSIDEFTIENVILQSKIRKRNIIITILGVAVVALGVIACF